MRLSMDIDHVFAKSVTEFILIDRICPSRMDILVFEFERYDIIWKIKNKKELEDDWTKIDSLYTCGIFSRDLFCIKQKEFRDKKLLISLSRIKNGYCKKIIVKGFYSKIARNREIAFAITIKQG